MITVKCDRCGAEVSDGNYRDITTNHSHVLKQEGGWYISDCVYRPEIHHQLCFECSRKFDRYFDKCVADFLIGGSDEN